MTGTELSAPSILYFDHAPHKRTMTSQLDIVLRGASVLDGSGTAAFAADIGIAGERIAAVERDESASAGSHGADPQDHEGPPGGRIQAAHQEGSGLQALGQTAAEAEVVTIRRGSNVTC